MEKSLDQYFTAILGVEDSIRRNIPGWRLLI